LLKRWILGLEFWPKTYKTILI